MSMVEAASGWRAGTHEPRNIYEQASGGRGRLAGQFLAPETALRVVAALNGSQGLLRGIWTCEGRHLFEDGVDVGSMLTAEDAARVVVAMGGIPTPTPDDLPARAEVIHRLEVAATRISAYEPVFVPGLLQTPAYTRALLAGLNVPPGLTETLLGIRRDRQRLLERPDRPALAFLVEEAALRRLVGGKAVMLAQLARIEELAAGGVSVQVVPADSPAHPGLPGTFQILDGLVFIEGSYGVGDRILPAGDYPGIWEAVERVASRPDEIGGILDGVRAGWR